MYSTFSLSLKPPPYPVLSSNLAYFGVLHMLHSDLLAQFTLLQVLHCQSLALNKPRLFSASVFPISVPPAFIILASVVFSRPHLLQLVLLAKFTFPHFLSGQIQSPSLTRKFLVDILDASSSAARSDVPTGAAGASRRAVLAPPDPPFPGVGENSHRRTASLEQRCGDDAQEPAARPEALLRFGLTELLSRRCEDSPARRPSQPSSPQAEGP